MDSSMVLARLLAPMETTDFIATRWQRDVVHVARTEAHRFADLGGLAALEAILAGPLPPVDTFRLIEDGFELPRQAFVTSKGRIDMDRVAVVFEAGASITVDGIDRYVPALATLCQELEQELSAEIHANLYATPRGSTAFPAHWDTHDVFVLQLEGSKDWSIARTPSVVSPLASQPSPKGFVFEDEPRTYRLDAGHTLYMPRGFAHSATCTASHSVHVTIGVTAITWADVVCRLVAELARADPGLRGVLPVGFARDALAAARAETELARVVAQLRALLATDDVIPREAARFSHARAAEGKLGRIASAVRDR